MACTCRNAIVVFLGMQMFTSLVAGSASTWVLTNSDPAITPSFHPSLWVSLQYIAFLSWSNLLLAPFQILISAYSMLSGPAIYIILWLGGSIAITAEIPFDCFQVQHCTQIRATSAFAWWTLAAVYINTMILWVTIRTNTTRIGGQAANAETVADEAGQPLSPIKKESTYLRRQAANAGTGANEAAPPLPPIKAPNAEIRPVKHLPSECLQCNKPCAAYRNFCQYSCKTMAERAAPKLIPIHGEHHMYRQISNLLSSSWRTGLSPSIRAIYAIVSTSSSQQVYVDYKRQIEEKRNCTAAGLRYGNEKLLWHGTGRSCRIGDSGQTTPCAAYDCNVCSIIKGSFDIARARVGMFGPGIYTTTTSSKADAFRRNKNPGIVWNALLLNRVVVGRSLDCYTRTVHTSAPDGYDAVQGIPGQSLGNDETIVYSNDAIRPAYLVMYSTP